MTGFFIRPDFIYTWRLPLRQEFWTTDSRNQSRLLAFKVGPRELNLEGNNQRKGGYQCPFSRN
jgi:hypothetical protein